MANFFGIPYTQGTWFGLPDFGITERFTGSQPQGNSGVPGLSSNQNISNVNFNPNVLGAQTNVPYNPQPQNKPGGSGTPPAAPIQNFAPAPSQPQAPQSDPYMDAINSVYGDSENILNRTEQGIRDGEQDFYKQYAAPFESQIPVLGQSRDTALAQTQNQLGQVQSQGENALSAARRLTNELMQGAQQRFGGVNSAGEFAKNFIGRELQRQMGDIQSTTGQNVQKLLDKQNEIQTNYSTQLQSLTQQKEGALAQARNEFQNKLREIDNARLGLSQNKAQLKLQALADLRNRAMAIEDQSRAYQQQLQQQVAQAILQTQSAVEAYRAQAGAPVNVNAIQQAVSPFMNYQGQGQTDPYAQIYGSLTPERRRELGLG